MISDTLISQIVKANLIKSFETIYIYDNAHHPYDGVDYPPYRCKTCDLEENSQNGLVYHKHQYLISVSLDFWFGNVDKEKFVKDTLKKLQSGEYEVCPLCCDVCPASFMMDHDIMRHIYDHKGTNLRKVL